MYLDKRKSNLLIFFCWLAYTSAYIGRLNYNACIVEITSALSVDKAEAGMVSSFFLLAYGLGQPINGFLSKRYNTRYVIAGALIISGLINFLMPVFGTISGMKYLWMLNGIVQSVLWTSIIKTQSVYLSPEFIPKASVVMSATVAVGTFAVYALSAWFCDIGRWKLIFTVASCVLVIAGCVWFWGLGKIEKNIIIEHKDSTDIKPVKNKLNIKKMLTTSALAMVVFAIADGFVKDGVTVWVPNILYENFGVHKSASILLTLFLPLLAICGASAVMIVRKKIKSNVLINSIFFGLSGILIFLIILTLPIKSVPLTMLLFAGVSLTMAGINNVLTSIVPLSCSDRNDAGLVAGIINAFCYMGSTLSITLLGYIADNKGWNDVFLVLLIFSAVALVTGVIIYITKRKNRI